MKTNKIQNLINQIKSSALLCSCRKELQEAKEELEFDIIKNDPQYNEKRYKDLMYGEDDGYEDTYQSMTKDANKAIKDIIEELIVIRGDNI